MTLQLSRPFNLTAAANGRRRRRLALLAQWAAMRAAGGRWRYSGLSGNAGQRRQARRLEARSLAAERAERALL